MKDLSLVFFSSLQSRKGAGFCKQRLDEKLSVSSDLLGMVVYCPVFQARQYQHQRAHLLTVVTQWQQNGLSCRFCCQDRLKVDGNTMLYRPVPVK